MTDKIQNLKEVQDVKRLHTLLELQGTLLARVSHFGRLGYQYDGDRDLYQALGYKLDLDYQDYYAQYRRQDIAKAIIVKPVSATWRGDLTLLEATDEKDTALEKEWVKLNKEFKLRTIFTRLDKLTAMGHYGVLLLGLDDTPAKESFLQAVKGGKRKLMFLKPLSEESAQIVEWDDNTSSDRYGLPTVYQISVSRPGGSTTEDLRVHYSRVIHIVGEDVMEDEMISSPKMEVVFNRLKDLEKLVGSSAEMFWRGARPGYHGKVDPDFQMTTETIDDLQNQINEYEHNLRRVLVNQGVSMESLTSQVSDPAAHVDVQIQMISAVTGIPKRILTGSERGELASSQDQDSWFGMIQTRREEYAEPIMVRAFVDRCIELGILPKVISEEDGYKVTWASMYEQSDKELADVGKIRSETLKNYSSAPTNQDIIPPDAFLRLMMNLDDDEIDLIKEQQEAMIAEEEKDMAEAEAAGLVPVLEIPAPEPGTVPEGTPVEKPPNIKQTPREIKTQVLIQGGEDFGINDMETNA